MNKIIKILCIVALLVIIVIGGIYIYKNFINNPNQPPENSSSEQTSAPDNSGQVIGDLKFAVAPVGIGTPGWESEPGYMPEYKNVFSSSQQIMLDFYQVTKPLGVEVKMYDQNDKAVNFFVPFSLKVGNNGNCCFNLPTEIGKYTVKVFSAGEILLTKNLEIK